MKEFLNLKCIGDTNHKLTGLYFITMGDDHVDVMK